MPHFLSDGSIIPQSFMLGRRKTHFQKKRENFMLAKARVDQVIYADDPRNTTRNSPNPQVQYICTVLGGSEAGRRIFNVRSVVPLGTGARFNASEVIQTPMLPGSPQDKQGGKVTPPEKTTGSLVLIARMHGDEDSAVIINNLKHPQSAPPATKEDGQRFAWEFAGINVQITKDGAFSLSFGGGHKDKDGKPANQQVAGGTIQISKDGVVSLSDGQGQEISIDKTNKKVSLKSSQALTMDAGSDWTINVSGAAKIQAGGNLDISGAVTNIGGGGFQAARVNDIVMGQDSRGGQINAWIAVGSGTVLIGG